MRNNVDLSPFRRSTVGFDRLFDMLESGLQGATADSYPPFDLVRESDDRHRINLAVAGFRPDEIDVVAQQNQLVVSGRKPEHDNTQYIHRGIATRNFERRFALADYVQVKSANLADGVLSIELVREVPEAVKPRKIELGGGTSRQQQLDASSEGNKPDTQHAA